jgi:hypothetical protein
MGINPAVCMANLYLYYYERCFLQRLLALYQRACDAAGHKPSKSPTDWDTAGIAALLSEPPGLLAPSGADAPQQWHLWSQAVLFLVHQFKCTVRFVDDLTAGCNCYLARLLYYRNSVLGGHVRGIYPGCAADGQPAAREFIVLESTPGDGDFSFCTLDVEIVSTLKMVQTPAGGRWQVTSATRLYGKRMQPCYNDIPMVRYTHISSAITPFAAYNILVGQLHRFQALITKRSSYVT